MNPSRLTTTVFDEEACDSIFSATLTVLEKTGVEVHDEDALAALARAGAVVDATRARIPRALVEDALASAPKQTDLPSRAPREALSLRDGPTYFGSGSDTPYIHGPGARSRRLATLADVEEMAALQEKLPGYDFVMSMALPDGLDEREIGAAQFAAMLRGTSKPIVMVTAQGHLLPVFHEMAAAAGDQRSWCLYAQPTSPLVHGKDSVERLVGCARLRVPLIYPTTVLPGATAPASRAGMMVVANAESLSGLVIHQLANPGAPFVYGVTQGSMDLRTGAVRYFSPEGLANHLSSADMARFFGLPSFGNGGASDSQMLDGQWAAEAAVSLWVAAMSRITLVHDVGYLASGMGSSYEACVFMDELIGYVRETLRGPSLDAESLALDEIMEVGPGGNFLARRHTREHRRDFVSPELLMQQPHGVWQGAGESSLLDRVAERSRELRAVGRAYTLPDAAAAALDGLEAAGRRLTRER